MPVEQGDFSGRGLLPWQDATATTGLDAVRPSPVLQGLKPMGQALSRAQAQPVTGFVSVPTPAPALAPQPTQSPAATSAAPSMGADGVLQASATPDPVRAQIGGVAESVPGARVAPAVPFGPAAGLSIGGVGQAPAAASPAVSSAGIGQSDPETPFAAFLRKTQGPVQVDASGSSGAAEQLGREIRASHTGDFAAGVKTGWEGLKGLGDLAVSAAGQGLSSLTGGAVGEGLRQWGYDAYKQTEAEAAPYERNRPTQIEDIKDLGSAADWFQYTLGNVAPSMAQSVAAAAIGAVAGSAATPVGSLAGAMTGAVASSALKKWLAKKVERQVAEGIERRVAEKQLGAAVGAGLGLFGSEYATGVGDIYSNTLDDEGRGHAAASMLLALPYAAAGAIADLTVAGRVLKGEAAKTLIGRVAGAVGGSAVIEGGEEVAQELVNLAGGLEAGKDYDSREVISRLANSFAAGAVAGGAFGVGGIRRAREPGGADDVALEQGGVEQAQAPGVPAADGSAMDAGSSVAETVAAPQEVDAAVGASSQDPADGTSVPVEDGQAGAEQGRVDGGGDQASERLGREPQGTASARSRELLDEAKAARETQWAQEDRARERLLLDNRMASLTEQARREWDRDPHSDQSKQFQTQLSDVQAQRRALDQAEPAAVDPQVEQIAAKQLDLYRRALAGETGRGVRMVQRSPEMGALRERFGSDLGDQAPTHEDIRAALNEYGLGLRGGEAVEQQQGGQGADGAATEAGGRARSGAAVDESAAGAGGLSDGGGSAGRGGGAEVSLRTADAARASGEGDAPLTQAQGIEQTFQAVADGLSASAHEAAIARFRTNGGLAFSHPDAVSAVLRDPRYNVEAHPDGSASVKGIFDSDAGEWLGEQSQASRGGERAAVPESAAPASRTPESLAADSPGRSRRAYRRGGENGRARPARWRARKRDQAASQWRADLSTRRRDRGSQERPALQRARQPRRLGECGRAS
jgi:hypothetical protein